MLYILTALSLIIASNLVAVIVIPAANIPEFVDIMVICKDLQEPAGVCSLGALKVGILSVLAAMTCCVLGIAASKRYLSATPIVRLGREGFVLIGVVVSVVCIAALVVGLRAPWGIDRADVFRHESETVSLSNLVWPLVLQAAALAEKVRWRLLFITLLVPLLATTPFRGVLFAVALFGVFLPIARFTWQEYLERKGEGVRLRLSIAALAIAVVTTAYAVAAETAARNSNLKLSGGVISQVKEKLAQRVAIPLYQGHLAAAYELSPRIPSITDEVLTKLRIRSGQSINGFLYSVTHKGDNFGETTSLYYGEGALRTSGPPVIWAVVAPLLLIIIFLGLRHVGYDFSILFAIAIWRGSLGGLVAVLPALALQVSFLVVTLRLLGVNRCGGDR